MLSSTCCSTKTSEGELGLSGAKGDGMRNLWWVYCVKDWLNGPVDVDKEERGKYDSFKPI